MNNAHILKFSTKFFATKNLLLSSLHSLSSEFTEQQWQTQIDHPKISKNPLTSLQCGALLQSYTNTKSVRKGQQLHAFMISCGVLFNNTYLYTKIAAMYAICGNMNDAHLIFDNIVLKNSFLWNIMIRGSACNGFSANALDLYSMMMYFGKRADNFTYPFVLKACGDLLLLETGRKIHCRIAISGLEQDIYVGNSLLCMYLKFGEMQIARQLFDRMPERDLTSWNTMILGYNQNGDSGEALFLFHLMEKFGRPRADTATILSVLPACADLAVPMQGKKIHGYVVRNGLELDAFVRNSLIDMYCKCGFMQDAVKLFEETVGRDVVSWNSMLAGYARSGDAIDSLRLFRRMHMERVVIDRITAITILGACDQLAALQCGRCVHTLLARTGFDLDLIVGTALVDMYAKAGCLDSSIQVFGEMPERNLISWSTMISGYGLHGRGRDSIALFYQMKTVGLIPDDVTFTSVLSACSHSGLVNEGWKIFNEIRDEYSLTPKVEHFACIVDLLGRAGYLQQAYDLINNMEVKPSIDVWAALLAACQVHHNIKLAEITAERIFELKPKGVGLYVALSNIYAAAQRWKDVEMVRAMVRQRGLKKPPGCSFVELDNSLHRFLVGDKSHPQSESIYAKLEDLSQQLKETGYKPNTSYILHDVGEDVKEKMLNYHSERLAIAFVLLNTSPGTTIRITKNLRVCGDCHTVTKLISKLSSREIIVRDGHRFHHFRDGFCSCGDYW